MYNRGTPCTLRDQTCELTMVLRGHGPSFVKWVGLGGEGGARPQAKPELVEYNTVSRSTKQFYNIVNCTLPIIV